MDKTNLVGGAIIDGKKHAAAIRAEVAAAVKRHGFDAQGNKRIKLAVVLVGDNPASLVYIGMKKKACEEVGFDFDFLQLPETSSEHDVLALIDKLNNDISVTGVIIQQPFPSHFDKNKILSRLEPRKDVDCLVPYNVGLATVGQGALLPCTPAGCIELIRREGIEITGKHAVVVGRSDIVGKPLALMLLAENATVTLCHSRTADLAEHCRRADILVAALGRPKFITADMVKPGAIIIDVGVNRLEPAADGRKAKICGDVDYENCAKKASYITPVPGGAGPMTVAILMKNCLKAWEIQRV
ncbi:MAG: bifunctional methylenetetrahydrofolate dehydrogenase/methenyltetrahydrofolate cyclohydrolase FolD [Defluviitaleaceae bacterium]|nr:bifunctional methylenetetrahydrofolate dehydrogenase/methenyltetrahydrofolate cyclohydrolase FolD [Defluviitaleaceae bacterium]